MILALQSKLNDGDHDVREATLNIMEFAANQGEIIYVILASCPQVCRCSLHGNIQYKHTPNIAKYAYQPCSGSSGCSESAGTCCRPWWGGCSVAVPILMDEQLTFMSCYFLQTLACCCGISLVMMHLLSGRKLRRYWYWLQNKVEIFFYYKFLRSHMDRWPFAEDIQTRQGHTIAKHAQWQLVGSPVHCSETTRACCSSWYGYSCATWTVLTCGQMIFTNGYLATTWFCHCKTGFMIIIGMSDRKL